MSTFKKAKVILLPTNEKSKITLSFKERSFNQLIEPKLTLIKESNYQLSNIQSQHLYIISDDEIKEGDYILNIETNNIFKADSIEYLESHNIIEDFDKSFYINSKYVKKVIATTDIKLGTCEYSDRYRESYFNPLPQPSQQFIEKYIEEYNKGNVITDVLVEYEGEALYTEQQYFKGYKDNLKINPKNNTITIKKVKDSWNREEVVQLLIDCCAEISSIHGKLKGKEPADLYKWIEENL